MIHIFLENSLLFLNLYFLQLFKHNHGFGVFKCIAKNLLVQKVSFKNTSNN